MRSATLKSKFKSALLPCVVKQGTPRRFVQINHPINGIFTPSQIQGKVSRTTRFPHPKVQRTTRFPHPKVSRTTYFLIPESRGRPISSPQSLEDDQISSHQSLEDDRFPHPQIKSKAKSRSRHAKIQNPQIHKMGLEVVPLNNSRGERVTNLPKKKIQERSD